MAITEEVRKRGNKVTAFNAAQHRRDEATTTYAIQAVAEDPSLVRFFIGGPLDSVLNTTVEKDRTTDGRAA